MQQKRFGDQLINELVMVANPSYQKFRYFPVLTGEKIQAACSGLFGRQ